MKDIEKIKNEIESYKKMQEYYKSLINELEELKRNPIVNRYLLLSNIDTKKNKKLYSKTNEDLLFDAYVKYQEKIEPTNNIYIYYGTFKNTELDKGKFVLLPKNDVNAQYNTYVSIENPTYIREIPIQECDEFEKNNTVIFLNAPEYKDDDQDIVLNRRITKIVEISKNYFYDSILYDEDKAKEKVLSKDKERI